MNFCESSKVSKYKNWFPIRLHHLLSFGQSYMYRTRSKNWTHKSNEAEKVKSYKEKNLVNLVPFSKAESYSVNLFYKNVFNFVGVVSVYMLRCKTISFCTEYVIAENFLEMKNSLKLKKKITFDCIKNQKLLQLIRRTVFCFLGSQYLLYSVPIYQL